MWELATVYMKKWLEFYCKQRVSIGDILEMTELVNKFLEWVGYE